MLATPRRPLNRGFTLVELLVVIAIIGLISAVAIPVVLPALNERRVSEAARILQAALAGTRDAAIRGNGPRGIRLLPDPLFGFAAGSPLASNRFVAIEPAPDYNEGVVNGGTTAPTTPIVSANGQAVSYLRVASSEYYVVPSTGAHVINAPTGWQYNIRQGDKIRFNDSGSYYTVAGPIHRQSVYNNPERYISYSDVTTEINSFGDAASTIIPALPLEYLNLTNGVDDNGNGWIDESCDGIDNDGDGITDPGFNGIDDDLKNGIDDPAELLIGYRGALSGDEYEIETFVGTQASTPPLNANYIIVRQAVVSPGSVVTTLPAGVVIDMTTWNAASSRSSNGVLQPTVPERSRLPVNPFSGYVDVLIDQTGRVIAPGAGSGGGTYYANSPVASLPFYHFWITEREGVVTPLWDTPATIAASTAYAPTANSNYGTQNYLLPMPQSTPNYTSSVYLKGERRLITLFAKTGQIVANSVESFNANDTSTPYYAAQSGTKESQ